MGQVYHCLSHSVDATCHLQGRSEVESVVTSRNLVPGSFQSVHPPLPLHPTPMHLCLPLPHSPCHLSNTPLFTMLAHSKLRCNDLLMGFKFLLLCISPALTMSGSGSKFRLTSGVILNTVTTHPCRALGPMSYGLGNSNVPGVLTPMMPPFSGWC